MGMTRWTVNGRPANARDVAEQLALGRQTVKKRSTIERESREREHDAKAVGRALRKGAREMGRGRFPIRCAPARVAGRRKGSLQSRRFETLVGLRVSRPSKVGSDGLSSFHFKFTSRGRGNGGGRAYSRGEAVKAVRYIMREAAREIEGGGIVSNISRDPDAIAGVFAVIEELEHLGRDNANIYMSLVIALPHELEDRERLLADVCAPFEKLGIPYAAVLHRPDKDGDQRNYHAHIMFSMRPFERVEDGTFAFSNETLSWMNTGAYITEFRARTAEVLNAAMAREGRTRRFTPLSNATRGASPPAKGEGKSTPGRKHHERRAEDIGRMQKERQLIATRVDEARELVAVLRDIIARPSLDDRLEAIDKQEAMISRSAAQKPTPPEAVQDDPAAAPIAASGKEPAPKLNDDRQTDRAVAHAQRVASVNLPPIGSARTEPPAPVPPTGQPRPRSRSDVVRPAPPSLASPNTVSSLGEVPGTPSPRPPKSQSVGETLRTAREAARRRSTAAANKSAANGSSGEAKVRIEMDNPWVRERSSRTSVEQAKGPAAVSPKAPLSETPASVPPTLEARIDAILKRYRKQREYLALSANERADADGCIATPCRFIADGLLALRLHGGTLEMDVRPDDIPFVDALIKRVPGGHDLLSRIAVELDEDDLPGPTGSWQNVVVDDVNIAQLRHREATDRDRS